MKVFLVCALFAVAFISLTSAGCSFTNLKSIQHTWSNKTTRYCEYEGTKYAVGSNFVDIDKCKHVLCTEKDFIVCGTGYYLSRLVVLGCAVVRDVCDNAVLNMEKTALCR